MKLNLLVLIGLCTLSFPTNAHAESSAPQLEILGSSIDDNEYPNHFTIQDSTTTADNSSDLEISEFQNPQNLFVKTQRALMSGSVSLINWINHRSPVSVPRERYNRHGQFGTWAADPDTCLNVRGMVLAKTSEVEVKTKPSAEGCIVISGKWVDPYSGRTFKKPYPDVEIDHMVPLKNAYIMGASKWSQAKRCWYANFIKNDYHLIPVSATENEIKSDSTPYDYVPAKEDYRCTYIKNWLKVKLVWKLAMLPPEAEAIEKIMTENHCSKAALKISAAELQKTRADIEAGSSFCKANFQKLPH